MGFTQQYPRPFTQEGVSELKLAPYGVSVSVVEPGNFKTNFKRKSSLRRLGIRNLTENEITEEQQAQYAETVAFELSLKEPDEVSEAFVHALFSSEPLRRYMVVSRKAEAEWTISKAISEVAQLNAWSQHGYSRDELVEMLDSALSIQPMRN